MLAYPQLWEKPQKFLRFLTTVSCAIENNALMPLFQLAKYALVVVFYAL